MNGLANYASDDDEDDAGPINHQSSAKSAPAVDAIAINHHSSQVVAVRTSVHVDKDISDRLDLPPAPIQPPDEAVVDKIRNYLELKAEDGFDMTNNIRSKKNFGNPYIFSIAVEHFKIDEIGSNYPQQLFDPHGYHESDYEAAIKKRYSGAAAPEEIRPGSVSNQERVVSTAAATSIATSTIVAAKVVLPVLPAQPVTVAVNLATTAAEQPPARKKSRWDKP